MRLLIVSGEEESRSTLLVILRANGYSPPLFASSCAEALAVLDLGGQDGRDLPVDVILVDADLPGDDGLSLCHRFEEAPCLQDIPRLLLSGGPAPRALALVRAAGASDFVQKPVQAAELLGRLHAAWLLKRQLDACRQHMRDLERVNCELQHLAVVDELTGIANRRSFNHVLAQELARASREMFPLSLLMIDIDHFKDYNDHFGHQRGDECLRRVAQCLTGVARRPGDHVARYGGEEFTVILIHTGTQGARTVAEALRAGVEGLHQQHPHADRDPLTISVGVASTVPGRPISSETLVAAADQALYEAKRDGRNRVRTYVGPLVHAPSPDPGTPPRRSAPTRAAEGGEAGPASEATPDRAGEHRE